MFPTGGGSSEFNFKSVVFALVLLFAAPICIAAFLPAAPGEYSEEIADLNAEYRAMTGSGPVSEAVWCLTGIYTPFEGSEFGYTSDGWLYGTRVDDYSPSQLNPVEWPTQNYSVQRGDNGVYTYTQVPAGQSDIEVGDTYTAVSFDVAQISDVFFTEAGKTELETGFFYYDYSGYRFAFSPLKNYTGRDQDGNAVDIIADQTTLSLIWYQYTTASSGVAGQLIVGTDRGLAYISSAQILEAFKETTSTAKFVLQFIGLDVNLYIRINPYALAQGLTIEECYDRGLWTVLITSLSTDIDAYTSANSPFSIYQIWDTFVALFTFNLDDYFELSGWMAVLLPFVFMVLMYGTLLAIGLEHQWVLIFAGILAVIQTISAALSL